MKTLLSLLLLGSIVLTNASDINNVLNTYMDAWNEHNIKKIDSFYDDHVIWYDLPSNITTKGKKNVSKAITDAFMGYVPDMFWMKDGDSFISENTISYEWVYGGTFTGMWGDQKVKNKHFSVKGFSTTTINKEGKIISQKDYYDVYGFMTQLGLIK